ncbi:hypothetical protein AJ79_09669 [Helicocarpus griseus UAMH5409]|uniref:FAD/NAD(P)-binding domain-containing protein n=1 Tax=Helicocarpus griseus UAMH5409 TaxID=1447875 RepID=A0A2B7W9K7_9EURO|nr:hypothetical protein AJ79_09669 [Helicocarpus griseus UAMH5409]
MEEPEPHTISLITAPVKENYPNTPPPDPLTIVSEWMNRLRAPLTQNNTCILRRLFHKEAWLRDMLVLSWDLRTIHGGDKIADYFLENIERAKFLDLHARDAGSFKPALKMAVPDLDWIETMFDFETETGRGSGVLRLIPDTDRWWKAYMLSFTLKELKGFEEKSGATRPDGGSNSVIGDPRNETWLQRRQREKKFITQEPTVLVVGAGHSGLEIGARLGQLGISTLIVERNARIGDNWRKRYKTLVTHDPVHYCQMPYLPFPSIWPTYTPKDKLADWFEAYANVLELNVWTSTEVESSTYNEETKIWSVKLRGADGTTTTVHPDHVVLATGHSGEPLIPRFSGQEQFKGKLYHATEHKDAAQHGNLEGKKVVVVGTGNSGHDIAQNFYESGADVTMLQRGGTFVISQKKGVAALMASMYDESGPPTDDADTYVQSMPIPVQLAFHVHATKMIAEKLDTELLEGLKQAGFKLDPGRDGAGIFRKYLTRGGGYYIDVGCSQLIIDGKIKVCQSEGGIERFESDGLVLADGKGTKLAADIVVLATGYENMKSTASKIVGDKVANKLSPAWDLDEEGELNARCFLAYYNANLGILTADVAIQRPPQLLVHGRKSGFVSSVFAYTGVAD